MFLVARKSAALAVILPLLCSATLSSSQHVEAVPASGALGATGFTAEVFGNVVMRGTPRCKSVVPNGFVVKNLLDICTGDSGYKPSHDTQPLDPLLTSIRLTGTLTPTTSDAQWHNFTVTTTESAWLRVWVDDHRIVDQWSGPHTTNPVTPGLLPNITLSAQREVFVRVDMRPWDNSTSFRIDWKRDGHDVMPVPNTALSPIVSNEQQQRRALQAKLFSKRRKTVRCAFDAHRFRGEHSCTSLQV
eukprot:m.773154 g.773154  ORF g.773154 m.773154 type:complete len:245 (-) comp23249_c0_seq2:850-1584(-)